jgi:hemerythrin
MNPIGWDPSLETGDALVDGQHRGIVDFANEVAALETDDVVVMLGVVDRLMEHVDTHFAAEEDLRTRGGYPRAAADEHKAQHRMLKDKARAATLGFRSSWNTTREPFVEFLSTWLLDHIEHEDRRLIEYLRTHGTEEPQPF